MQRLDFPVELERVRNRSWREEMRELMASIEQAAERLDSDLSQTYFDSFLAPRWVPAIFH